MFVGVVLVIVCGVADAVGLGASTVPGVLNACRSLNVINVPKCNKGPKCNKCP